MGTIGCLDTEWHMWYARKQLPAGEAASAVASSSTSGSFSWANNLNQHPSHTHIHTHCQLIHRPTDYIHNINNSHVNLLSNVNSPCDHIIYSICCEYFCTKIHQNIVKRNSAIIEGLCDMLLCQVKPSQLLHNSKLRLKNACDQWTTLKVGPSIISRRQLAFKY